MQYKTSFSLHMCMAGQEINLSLSTVPKSQHCPLADYLPPVYPEVPKLASV
jgi:hypothetical protein